MLKIAFIIFRESLEIVLLLGIIMAVTKMIKNSRIYIIAGILLGVISASLFAFFAKTISLSLSGMGDEALDSGIILVTVLMICLTVVWIQNFGSTIKHDIENLSKQIENGLASRFILVSIVASAFLREGVEIILLIYSITSIEQIDADSYLLGLALGTISGVLSGFLIYWGLLKFAKKYLFSVSSLLLMFIAAGLSAEAAGILTSSGIIEIFSDQLWDSSWLIDERSYVGKLLKALIGYTAKPNGAQIMFYFSTLGFIVILTRLSKKIFVKAIAKRAN